ncbi:reverse transcriptase family protein [Litoreibacter roseus]|nr:reverse transcriptase family protein [Litoreibacter roseus]
MIVEFPQRYAPDANRIAEMLSKQLVVRRLFKHCNKADVWPSLPLEPPRMLPVAPFDALVLPTLHTAIDLADWLLLTPEQLDAFVDRNGWRETHPMPGVNNYFYRMSPKSSGGLRLIEAPKPRLKSLQRLINHRILAKVPTHPDSFGFVRGRNCIGAAQRHAGEEVVIGLDLKNYFSSLRYGRVYAFFRHLGYPVSVAHGLSGICTIVTPSRIRQRMPYEQRQTLMEPHLPQGAPSSPALANLLTYRLDRRLAGLARSLGANYTRYADDLTFSGDSGVRDAVLTTVPEIVEEEGFRIRTGKTRIMPCYRRQMVLGIVVNETINISRKEFDRLKAIIHQKAWKNDPAEFEKILGQIGWVEQVNPSKAQKLYAKLELANAREHVQGSST